MAPEVQKARSENGTARAQLAKLEKSLVELREAMRKLLPENVLLADHSYTETTSSQAAAE